MRYKKNSIRKQLSSVVLFPILILGILIVVFGIFLIYGFYSESIHNELAATTHMMIDCLDLTVRGDYAYEDGMLIKGDINITDSTMLYRIKEETEIDTTIFWEDTRILTTVQSESGVSAVGTKASPDIIEHVLENGENYFSKNVKINGEAYIGYYAPLENSTHVVVGMIFAGKNKMGVYKSVGILVLWFVLFSGIAVIFAVVMSKGYSNQMVSDIDLINQYLQSISEGDLTVDMDERIINRTDEIGEIGIYAEKMRSDLQKLIEMDPLTSLYNRRSCNHQLSNLMKNGISYTIVMCDIDWFKKINDQYGHDAGDYVLVKISEMIRQNLEGCGFASRWGGEEFLLIYTLDFDETMKKVEELQQSVRDFDYLYDTRTIKVTMTFGVKEYESGVPYERLIKSADYKLYTGKRNGRNQIVS
ncbi:MAG: diguanylate cyclase [Lachnospiraceae bacterium]|nr:diguanylate cyclase [Lachnospiraceae bacterium]